MEFLPKYDGPTPKTLVPCLATITIGDMNRSGRRMSNSSFTGKSDDGNDDGGNPLKRVISGGGRRKSSFGTGTAGVQSGEERRASLVPGSAGVGGDNVKGTWYWRVQAGVTDSQLVLLPLSQPANPILTRAPPPLSEAMPAHSAQPIGGSKTAGTTGTHDAHTGTTGDHHEDGLIDKLKNMFRRGSTAESDHRASTSSDTTAYNATTESSAGTAATYNESPGTHAAGSEGVVPNKDGKVDRILDQTARGEQLPTGGANALGATNVNANAETGFPGVLHNGQKCGAIVVGLTNVDRHKIELKGGRTHEGSWVNVPVISHFASMVQGMGDYPVPKTGFLKLEFDKDWIGAKAEAEVLHFNLTDAIMNRSSPVPAKLQLASGGHSHPNPGMAEVHASRSQRASIDATNQASQPGFVLHNQHSGHGLTGSGVGTASGTHSASTGAAAPPLTGGGGIVAGGAPGIHAMETTPDASIASGHKVPGTV